MTLINNRKKQILGDIMSLMKGNLGDIGRNHGQNLPFFEGQGNPCSDYSLSDCDFSLIFLEGKVTSPFHQGLSTKVFLFHFLLSITINIRANEVIFGDN